MRAPLCQALHNMFKDVGIRLQESNLEDWSLDSAVEMSIDTHEVSNQFI
jgi:hypothetical protein